MTKFSPILFIISSALLYLTAFTSPDYKALYIALGTVFLILGVVAYRRISKTK
jgi:hypothetical protein